MRKLCIYYKSRRRGLSARDFQGKKIEWIVCKECQQKIESRKLTLPVLNDGELHGKEDRK